MGAFFPHYKDTPSNIVGEGYMPNIESLLAIDPDLVFQWDVLGDDIVSPIRKAGLEVAILKGMKDENTARRPRAMVHGGTRLSIWNRFSSTTPKSLF